MHPRSPFLLYMADISGNIPRSSRQRSRRVAPGYAEFLEAWRDPSHEEHKAMRRWAGRTFDPERFDPEATTKAIAKALRRCRGGYRFRLGG